MRRRISASVAVTSLVIASAVALAGAGTASTHVPSKQAQPSIHYLKTHYTQTRSCRAVPRPGHATCYAAHLVPTAGSQPLGKKALITGLTPANVQSAYVLTGLTTTGTVAIVDAYGYPRAEADLATYRAQWGLPACTTANGCLRIINQKGGTATHPPFNLGWAQEQALDLDAVSAACPTCKIVLVQAKSPTFANLGAAVNRAAKQAGVVAISNSYGGSDAPDSSFQQYYKHKNIAVTASAGDSGFVGASYPASSKWVTAVGGTSLVASGTTRGWSETVWTGTGSGCSTFNGVPVGQNTTVTHCAKRAMNDVAAVADPNTGLAVVAPTSSTTSSWAQYGGTSLSSPIIASVYALSGNTAGFPNTIPYAHASSLFDVTVGSNGGCSFWCTAAVGWDGPTGLGTPNGTAAF